MRRFPRPSLGKRGFLTIAYSWLWSILQKTAVFASSPSARGGSRCSKRAELELAVVEHRVGLAAQLLRFRFWSHWIFPRTLSSKLTNATALWQSARQGANYSVGGGRLGRMANGE